jgi:hypothetical protein
MFVCPGFISITTDVWEQQYLRIVTRLWDVQLGFSSWQGLEILLLITTTSRPALGPTQPPVQWLLGALSLGIKQLAHKADHSLASSA